MGKVYKLKFIFGFWNPFDTFIEMIMLLFWNIDLEL